MTEKLKLLEAQLKQTLEDGVLTKPEKYSLQSLVESCSEEERRFLVNRAFDIAREPILNGNDVRNTFSWLERVSKALQPPMELAREPVAYFSPGKDCRNIILKLIEHAKESLDICVFTISDNLLADAILNAHRQGIKVRILTDNEKAHDTGSDILRLAKSGLEIREDAGPDHMHHKFSVFDKKVLLNGSFNWTRSATERNYENVAVNYHPKLVQSYQHKFEELWADFKPNQL